MTAIQRHSPTLARRLEPISPRRWLRRLEEAIDVVRRHDTRDGAHRLRVACGRVRVWLELSGNEPLRAELKRLREAAADLRNLDAQLERDPPSELRQEWSAARHRARADLLAELARSPPGPLLESLRALPPASRAQARSVTRALSNQLLRQEVESRTELHALRRRVRRLRYALEWQGRLAPELERLQQTLGTACDFVVALELSRGRHQHHFRSCNRRAFKKARREAIDAWAALRPWVERLAR